MKNRIIPIVILCVYFIMLFGKECAAERGVVVKEHDDKYAIEYSLGYLLVEWYGGYSPSEGDVYAGDFSGYGFKDLYCVNQDQETHFWVDDYMANEDDALEFLYD